MKRIRTHRPTAAISTSNERGVWLSAYDVFSFTSFFDAYGRTGLPPPSVPEMSAVYGSQPIMVGIPHRPGNVLLMCC